MKEIAEQKMKDLNAIDLDGAIKQIEGTARSMGINVLINFVGVTPRSVTLAPRRIKWLNTERNIQPLWLRWT